MGNLKSILCNEKNITSSKNSWGFTNHYTSNEEKKMFLLVIQKGKIEIFMGMFFIQIDNKKIWKKFNRGKNPIYQKLIESKEGLDF